MPTNVDTTHREGDASELPSARSPRARLVLPAIICALLVVAVVALNAVGLAGRTYAAKRRVVGVTRPQDAYSVWRESGVRGRVLVSFAYYISVDDSSQPQIFQAAGNPAAEKRVVSERNFLTAAEYAGMIRRVYQVVPDAQYDQLAARIAARDPSVSMFMHDGPRIVFVDLGVPVEVTKASELPSFSAPVLVYADKAQEAAYDPAVLRRWLSDPKLSDLVVVNGR